MKTDRKTEMSLIKREQYKCSYRLRYEERSTFSVVLSFSKFVTVRRETKKPRRTRP